MKNKKMLQHLSLLANNLCGRCPIRLSIISLHNGGFTLMELLVVIVIIGILAAVALPQYQLAVDKVRYAAMMAAVKSLKQSQELYYLTNGTYATSVSELNADIPGECTPVLAHRYDCQSFWLTLEPTSAVYAYGTLKEAPKNAYLAYYDKEGGAIHCYAYPDEGTRGERLCAAFSKQKPVAGCYSNGTSSCKIYTLK